MTGASTTGHDLVVEYLRNRDVACPACGYNLRDCASRQCPECGGAVQLEVAARRSGRMWWMMGIFGLSLTTALAVLLLFVTTQRVGAVLNTPHVYARVNMGVASSELLPNWSAIRFLTIFTAVCGGCWCALWAGRRVMMTWPKALQVVVAFALLLSPLLLYGAAWVFLR